MNQDATKLVVNVWESWSFFLDFYGGMGGMELGNLMERVCEVFFFGGVVEDEAKLASDKTLRTLLEGGEKKKKKKNFLRLETSAWGIRFSCGGRHLLYR